jgi:predicted O-methyltransferase YrrM
VTANIERFCGFASEYDSVRPQPPEAALDLLCKISGTSCPELVVDLGSGTGLSSRIWIGRALRVVAIEPNADMRGQAARATPPGAVDYIDAVAMRTAS